MLIQKRFWEPIGNGEVTLIFRRWKRSQVLADRTYRTAAGRLRVTAVTVIDPTDITDIDAERAGYPTAAKVIEGFRGDRTDPIYRIEFQHLDEPDPRTKLANDTNLGREGLEEIDKRLARLDAASKSRPWTIETLKLIEAHPEQRAPDLAAMARREVQPFKLDVRKLKNLGLTLSFRIGYRLSPRGHAYLAARRSAD